MINFTKNAEDAGNATGFIQSLSPRPLAKSYLCMEKIGVCGTPSLWVQKEELIKEKHIL